MRLLLLPLAAGLFRRLRLVEVSSDRCQRLDSRPVVNFIKLFEILMEKRIFMQRKGVSALKVNGGGKIMTKMSFERSFSFCFNLSSVFKNTFIQ